jgi:hypothetical protein
MVHMSVGSVGCSAEPGDGGDSVVQLKHNFGPDLGEL